MKRRDYQQNQDDDRDLVDLMDCDIGEHCARNHASDDVCEDYDDLARSLHRCPSLDESEMFAFEQEADHVMGQRHRARVALLARRRVG